MTTAPLKTFICYAREDRAALESLMGHLAVFQRNGQVQFWYDREITGGKNWDDEIRFNLKTADIVLLLVSPDFFRSDYIHSVELDEALRADRAGEALVVPVILKKCLWHKDANISRLQALPAEGKPVFDKTHWPDPDDALYNIAEEFDRILEDPATAGRRLRRIERIQQEEAAEREQLAAEAERQKQEAEAAEQKRRDEAAARLKAILPEMVFVQGGTFQMGEKGVAEPVHEVTLSDFEIGKYPVTQKLWQEIMGNNPSHFKGCDDCPVESVSWDDVQEFLEKLNARFPGKNYRLPTEAEWEYAARGGALDKGYAYSGFNSLTDVGWFWENSGDKPLSGERKGDKVIQNNCRTHPVGQKRANELGLHDMSGNVWEWCADWHDTYSLSAQTNPTGPKTGSRRVGRGGSWNNSAGDCHVSRRGRKSPDDRNSSLGFRVASSSLQ